MKYSLLLAVCLLLFSTVKEAKAQENQLDSAAIYNMTLEELINIKSSGVSSELENLINSLIGVASKKPLSSRKSPSIVTVISQEEIRRSGARDIIDILRLVPGFDFGVDVQGAVGLGVRGNWANEGKVLLMLDGQEMNEILYSTTQFGNNFLPDQIKRIEIIRGPGSSIYGGFAEYGVINIITKDGEDLNGVQVNGTYGQLSDTYGRRNVNVAAGTKIKDFVLSVSGTLGQGQRSNHNYTDFDGNSYNMKSNSQLNTTNVNVGIRYKELSFRGIYDQYNNTIRDGYGAVLSKAYPNNFTNYLAELKYNWKISNKIVLTPKLNYKNQAPWNLKDSIATADSLYSGYNKIAQRFRAGLTMSYDITKKINLNAGGEFFYDKAVNKLDDGDYFSNGTYNINYSNYAGFVQALFRYRIANFTVGARYDHNNAYGSAFVPRLGITKKINRFNFKVLYSNSFRAPGIENINQSISGAIRPEQSQVFEAECGYQLMKSIYMTVGYFDITTRHPIIYFIDTSAAAIISGNPEGYKNLPKVGSRGIEVDLKAKTEKLYVDLNYSFYHTGNKNEVPDYQVSGKSGIAVAFPAHKINLNSNFNLFGRFWLGASGSFMSARYAYASIDSTGTAQIEKFSPVFLANLYVSYEDMLVKGLTAGVGCYDLFDQRFLYLQPYNGYHAPLPGTGREIIVKLSYQLNLKNK